MASQRIFFIGVISAFSTVAILPLAYLVLVPLLEGGGATALLDVFEMRHLALAKNSLMIALGTALTSWLIGSVYAFLISRTDMPGRKNPQWRLHIAPADTAVYPWTGMDILGSATAKHLSF